MTKVGRAAMSTKASVTNRLDVERIEARSKRAFRRSIRAAVRSSWRRPANGACASFVHHQRHTRPGGTISGAAMFMLADFAVYVAIIAALGEIGLTDLWGVAGRLTARLAAIGINTPLDLKHRDPRLIRNGWAFSPCAWRWSCFNFCV